MHPKEGRPVPGWVGLRERTSETTLPDRLVVKIRSVPARVPVRIITPSKCTSHFGIGLDNNHLDGIINRYPLRESNVFKTIADALEISKANYEKKVVSRVREDNALASKLRESIQPLSSNLISEQP